MIKIYFQKNGKRIDPKKIKDHTASTIFRCISDLIGKGVDNLYCTKHLEYPTIICIGNTFEDFTYQIHSCCDVLQNETSKRLKSL
ncbi:MAG: hypothetical protein ACI86H_001543 [bacterium]|jgi:hypothetical protein